MHFQMGHNDKNRKKIFWQNKQMQNNCFYSKNIIGKSVVGFKKQNNVNPSDKTFIAFFVYVSIYIYSKDSDAQIEYEWMKLCVREKRNERNRERER